MLVQNLIDTLSPDHIAATRAACLQDTRQAIAELTETISAQSSTNDSVKATLEKKQNEERQLGSPDTDRQEVSAILEKYIIAGIRALVSLIETEESNLHEIVYNHERDYSTVITKSIAIRRYLAVLLIFFNNLDPVRKQKVKRWINKFPISKVIEVVDIVAPESRIYPFYKIDEMPYDSLLNVVFSYQKSGVIDPQYSEQMLLDILLVQERNLLEKRMLNGVIPAMNSVKEA